MIAKRVTAAASERLAQDVVLITLECAGLHGVTWEPNQKLQVAMGSVLNTRTYTLID